MEHAPRGDPDVRHRWVFAFQVDGDLRFVSHHDMLRLFRRALARADVPVRFTQGFNPHPRMSLPLPRPVGMASDVEALMIETQQDVDPDEILGRLEQHTPADLKMVSARRLAPRERLEPEWVRYSFRPEPPPRSSDLSDELKTKIRLVLDAETTTMQDVVVIFVTASGHRHGGLAQETYARKVYGRMLNGTERSAIQITTASAICAALDLVREGRLPGQGFIKQEQIALDVFLANRFGATFAEPGDHQELSIAV